MRRTFGLFFAVAVFAAAMSAQEIYIKPVDEAAKDPSLMEFRSKLIDAAERKDMKYVISVMDPKIKLSFGGHEGIADFKQIWQPDIEGSLFWNELLAVLKNGGVFGKDTEDGNKTFYAPYTFTSFPDYPELDIFRDGAIIGKDVNLRAKPSLNAKVIGSLSYNVVMIDHQGSVMKKKTPGIDMETYEWYKVETLGGKKGFVHADHVRGHVDHRIGLEKQNGKWKITMFIAGD